MTEVVLFHHAQGLTPGVAHFAASLRSAGHSVHAPDVYEGRTFDDLDDGVAHLESVGFGELSRRAMAAISGTPSDVVYVGMSMGANLVENALLTRPGALGAVLLYGQLSPEVLDVPDLRKLPTLVQHSVDDPWIDDPGDEVVAAMQGSLFVYPGAGHLLADPISPDYDAAPAELVLRRTVAFLDDRA